jgi:hypothetical protein
MAGGHGPHLFEVTDDVFDLGVAAVIGLKLEGGAVAVGDERVVVIVAEQRELAARGGAHAAHD